MIVLVLVLSHRDHDRSLYPSLAIPPILFLSISPILSLAICPLSLVPSLSLVLRRLDGAP